MTINLDAKDRKILLKLDMNARQPDSVIAKAVGLSKQVTNYRIKRLEKNKVIKGYHAAIDHTKLGLKLYKILLRLENLDPEKEKSLLDFISKKASWAAKISGDWDLAFSIYEKDEYEFMDFWSDFYSRYGVLISERMVTIMTRFWNYERSIFFPRSKNRDNIFLIGAEPAQEKIDDIDRKILDELSSDARKTSLEIANKIKETERIVRYRIKRLEEKKVLLGYRAEIDTNLLGLNFYKLFINLKDVGKKDVEQIRNHLTQDFRVAYSTESFSGPDFEIEVYFKSSQELNEFIEDLKKEFFKKIRSVEHMEYITELKVTYYPTA